MDDDTPLVDNPMERCVDAGDIDGLLALVSLDEIAIAWHRYTAISEPKSYDHPDWWAIELFWDSTFLERTDLRRALLLKLVEHSPNDRQLGIVGAGPLEDFVSDHEDDLRWLETQCATNPGLRTALAGVWAASFVTEATMQRLDAAARTPLSRPRPRSEWPPELAAVDDAKDHLLEVVPGGMAAYRQLHQPTEAQRAAAAAYEAAETAWLASVDARLSRKGPAAENP